MKKFEVSLLTRNQFGYQTDFFNYFKYLSRHPDISDVRYVCFDATLPKYEDGQAGILYVARQTNSKFLRFARLVAQGYKELAESRTVIVKYFPGVSLLRISKFSKNLIIDVRTLSVSPNPLRRTLEDLLCKIEIQGFTRVTVVSDLIGKKLWLRKWTLLPLGADLPEKQFQLKEAKARDTPILVYAGTLDGRNLTMLLQAFKIALQSQSLFLRIVGDGRSRTELMHITEKIGVSESVCFYGHVKHGLSFSNILSSSTFGLVHVPPTGYYAGQPSTKLYEYWSHGLPVLCSNYPAGAVEIKPGTGLVYDFTTEELAKCILRATERIDEFDYSSIRKIAMTRTWETLINSYLIPAIKSESPHSN